MVNAMSKRFDPAEHLTKQGWKGKGTALKNGHLTRPLAVVQKKTLSGVGKDRDEAVPFWDQIFASTAASLSLPSTPLSPSPSGSPGASTLTPKLADPRLNKSSPWQTSGSSSTSNSRGQSGLSVNVRISRESARRGLYSRFLRGKVEIPPEGEESEMEVEQEILRSGTLTPAVAGPSSGGDIINTTGTKETKEERRAKRAEKALRKAEKEVRRQEKEKRRTKKVDQIESVERPDMDADVRPSPISVTVGSLGGGSDDAKIKKRKKDKSTHVGDESQAEGVALEKEDEMPKKEKKKKRRRGEELDTS